MAWWIWMLIGVGIGAYVLGFCFAFWLNVSSGNITLGLALLRSFLWPLWLAGMIPGQQLRM